MTDFAPIFAIFPTLGAIVIVHGGPMNTPSSSKARVNTTHVTAS
jgi:hypothetical protein